MQILFFALSGCGNRDDTFECTSDVQCKESSAGQCATVPGGRSWCRYPDPTCATGWRWSEQAGEGLARECAGGSAGSPDAGSNDVTAHVMTGGPIVVTETTIEAQGNIESLGAPAATDHGLCLGMSTDPASGSEDVVCSSLGAPSGPGTFSWIFGALSPGTLYHLRAFATSAAGIVYGVDVAVWTLPPGPSGLAASEGTSADRVSLSWNAAAGATGYRIYRDGLPAGTVSAATSFYDTGATAPGAPAAPAAPSTTLGTYPDKVRVAWSATTVPDGPTHIYSVSATNDSGEGERSEEAIGYRAAYPVTSYAVSRDGGYTWQDVGLVTTWDDTGASPGAINPGEASVSEGILANAVVLSLPNVVTTPGGLQSYRVSAINASGASQPSTAESGYRGVGTVSYQWQRTSIDAQDASYADLIGATTGEFYDTTAPDDGSARYYRCIVSAAGAVSQMIGSWRGFRRMPPWVRQDVWVANGPVLAMAEANGVLYLGGEFTYFGKPTGSFVAVDSNTGAADPARPSVNGPVYAVAPDGAGGWFLGGRFTAIGGVLRRGLAHIRVDGTLDPAFSSDTEGSVRALAVSGTTLYVGGFFRSIHGLPRQNIAALDSSTGAPIAWYPQADQGVESLAVSEGVVYVSGYFGTIGGASRNTLAALDAASGMATAWNPHSSGLVSALAVSGSTVYVGGWFDTIGGARRNRIAALDASSGAATAWNPNADGWVYSLAVSGSTVYVGGYFASIGGKARSNIAALDSSSGIATAWNPSANWEVHSLAVRGDRVYVGGWFSAVGGQERNHLAALDVITGVATSWNPNANAEVYAVATDNSTVYVGGEFSSVGGERRNHVAAIDTSSGVLNDWNPNADYTVSALAVSGSTVYAGGCFSSIGGKNRSFIAALDALRGTATAWNPAASGCVDTLAVGDSAIYAGGEFSEIGGQSRNFVAALAPSSGAATLWNPNADARVRVLTISGDTLYVGGDFTSIGGKHRNYVAALYASNGTAAAWNPSADSPVRAFAVNGNTVYVGGDFTSIGAQNRSFIAALDASSGAATSWNPIAADGGGGVSSLAVSGNMVYVGGGFAMIGGEPRDSFAVLDASSGSAMPWNPDLSNFDVSGEVVRSLVVTGNAVYVGGEFKSIGGQIRRGLAVFEP